MSAQDIIDRCTRNGVTAWANVAKQLGRSVDSVRAQHDQSYMRAHIWAPSREHQPEMEAPEDPDDTRSPHVKPVPLKVRVLAVLGKHSLSAETLAAATGTTLGCAKWQLSVMKREGSVQHTTRLPYTWSLTDAGKLALAALRQPNGSRPGVAA
jgi:hypothetical protein